MRKVVVIVAGVLLFVGLVFSVLVFTVLEAVKPKSPVVAARHFRTKLTRQLAEPLAELPNAPPESLYQRVEYAGPTGGRLWAWMSRPPEAQKRHPAIVWISGGFPPGGFPNDAWLEHDPNNDQSAAQYMRAGITTLYPTTRGMEGNAGTQESFLGEVADVVSAVEWLRAQPYVDSTRVYVGGHSSGATLALLVSASTPIAGVIAMGPTDSVCAYGAESLTFDVSSEEECVVRAPVTYSQQFPPGVILEGAWTWTEPVDNLSRWPSKGVSYVHIPRYDHFFPVGAMNELFAAKIARGEALTLTVEEAVAALDRKFPATEVKANDGWSVTVPPGFIERSDDLEPGERVFRNSGTYLRIGLEKESPVTCERDAIKGRGQECFRYEAEDGTDRLFLTAQRGTALFISVSGVRSQEQWLVQELNLVLDSARPPPAGP